jgi:hypothetical protein
MEQCRFSYYCDKIGDQDTVTTHYLHNVKDTTDAFARMNSYLENISAVGKYVKGSMEMHSGGKWVVLNESRPSRALSPAEAEMMNRIGTPDEHLNQV